MLTASLRKVFMLTTSGNQSSNNCEDITQRKMQMRILPIFNMLNLFLLNFNRKTYCSFSKKVFYKVQMTLWIQANSDQLRKHLVKSYIDK